VEFSHVVVNALALGERREADPTRMCMAPCTRHVVAPRCALDRRVAPWALFHVVIPHPLLEQAVPSVLAVLAGNAFVIFDVARRADAYKAGWTG
jgi:hypothetical protein